MICKRCGTEFSDNMEICPQCGEIVEPEETKPKVSLKKESAEENNENDIHNTSDTQQTEEREKEQTEEKGQREEKEEDILQFSDTSFSNFSNGGVTGYNDPIPEEKEKKKGKGPIIAVGILVAALVALVLYLVVSLFIKEDSVRKYVKKAFHNTVSALTSQEDEIKDYILNNDVYKQECNFLIDELSVKEYGQEIVNKDLLGTIRFGFGSTIDQTQKIVWNNLRVGFSDMNDINLEVYFDGDTYYLGLSDLYEKFFQLEPSDLGYEISPKELLEQQKTAEAMLSLTKGFSDLFSEHFELIEFTKEGKEVLDEEEMQVVQLSMERKDYNSFLDGLEEMIKENDLFLEWLETLTSKEEVEDFLEEIEDMVEEAKVDNTVKEVLLCTLFINNKKQIAGIKIPFENEAEETEGEIGLYLLGKDKLIDNMKFIMDITEYGYNTNVTYFNYKDGEDFYMDFTILDDGNNSFNMSCSYHYEENDDIVNISFDDININLQSPYVQFFVGLNGNYSLKKAEKISMPSRNAVKIMDMSEEEIQEVVLDILKNILDGGYIPSAYQANLYYFIKELEYEKNPYDYEKSDLDGSDRLSYEEFKEVVNEVYGDIFTEEELKELYEEIYGNDMMAD